jgi:hypothetical protein
MLFKHSVKANFTVENEAAVSRAPVVNFETSAVPPTPPAPAAP